MPADRDKTTFFCAACGYESPKWMGFCPACGDRTPLAEAPRAAPGAATGKRWLSLSATLPTELASVSLGEQHRRSTSFGEFDRVLGGGLVDGSIVLMAGEPGIGKSTLLLQAAQAIADCGLKVLYASGEESDRQVKLRAQRLGVSGSSIYFLSETDVDALVARLDEVQPGLGIVDSIQTLSTQEVPSAPGSVVQVRECTRRLMQWAKARGTPVLIAGHVTKDGTLAGPRVLEHMVDVVLYMEGESVSHYRLLRSTKNRFGSTNEVGVFEMGGKGLIEVPDPSVALLSERRSGAVGSVIVPTLEGSRPLMVEVQALTSPSILPAPRRTANGVDFNRLIMVSAVLSQRAGVPTGSQDILLNVVGGLTVNEPACDLAVALAIASSLRGAPAPGDLVAVGELSLTGDLRSAPQLERRLREAARLGFKRCLVPPQAAREARAVDGVRVEEARTLRQALRTAFRDAVDGQEDREDT